MPVLPPECPGPRATGGGARRRRRLLRRALAWAALAVGAPAAAAAPEVSINEFWPEIDVFVRLDPQWRLFLLGGVSRGMETGISTESTLGVHLDYFVRGLPAGLVAMVPGIDEDWSVSVRTGYNRIVARNPDGPNEDRLILEGTIQSRPLWQSLRFANRSRIDLRRIGDEDSWRYRNRSRVERTWALPAPGDGMFSTLPAWAIASAATPYLLAEFFWDSRPAAWSRRTMEVGVELALARDRSLTFFLNRQLDLRTAGGRLTALGVALTLNY
jgi:hypothetical protein